jgi:hypothetical protein
MLDCKNAKKIQSWSDWKTTALQHLNTPLRNYSVSVYDSSKARAPHRKKERMPDAG